MERLTGAVEKLTRAAERLTGAVESRTWCSGKLIFTKLQQLPD
jgi:hypothetical protein